MKHSSSRSGYTLAEILISAAAFLVVMAGVYSLFYCAKTLTFKNIAMNSTGAAAHLSLDQVQSLLQQAYTSPLPINSSGTVLSNTLSLTGTAVVSSGLIPVVSGSEGTVTGTGVGILFYRYISGPFLTLITSTSGLSGSATSMSIQMDTAAQMAPVVPKAGDALVINTTALLSGNGYQVWATVSGSAVLTSSSGTKRTYTIPLTPPLKDKDGNTVSGISYQTDNTGQNSVTWSTSLMRPTALLISTRNSKTELGLLDPCVTSISTVTSGTAVTSTTTVLSSTNYTTLTTELDIDPQHPSCFSTSTLGSKPFVGLILRIRSSEYDNYLLNKQFDSFSTYMGLNSFIELKSVP